MSDNLESVMRRIQKLLAIAQDDRANPHEAASAAGMAEKLMRKYQLDNEDLIIKDLQAGVDMTTEDCLCTAKTNGTKVKSVPLWAGWIASNISDLNTTGARICRNNDMEAVVRFYGYKADVQVSKYMMSYLVATVNRLCREFKKTDLYMEQGRPAMNSYRQGVALGICSSIKQLVTEREAEQKAKVSTSTSLMVVKQDAVVAKFGEVFNRKISKTQVRRNDAHSIGYQDGKVVNINSHGIQSSVAPIMIS